MYREPAFMKDLHKMQAKEYEKTKSLSLHEYVKTLEKSSQKVLKQWGLKEKSLGRGRKQIVPAGK